MIYIFGGAFDPPHVGHTSIVKAILHYKNSEKIIIIPSSVRNDKSYAVSDDHRLAMLDIFCDELNESIGKDQSIGNTALSSEGSQRVIVDDYFVRNWKGEMITKDVDLYAKEKYGEDISHIFGTDTIESMPEWDCEGYAAKVARKIFVPRRANNNSTVGPSFVPLSGEILNFELFTDSHIPEISSTALRQIIPEYTGLKTYFEESPKFIIPGLSKRISQYILENRLYRPLYCQREAFEGLENFVSEQNPQSPHFSSTAPLQKELKRPRILVHVCCGPDATMPILQLREEYEVICFWYDPNIQPKSEYDKRYEAFVKVCEIEKIPYIKGAYDVANFFTRIKGVEHTPERGEKCTYCYDMRMMVTAKLAQRLHIPIYTSSLNTSPKKDLEKLFQMGHKYAEKYGIKFLDIPFRKKGGFEKSVEYTKEHDIFRQNYCGCIYSIREGGDSDLKRKMVG